MKMIWILQNQFLKRNDIKGVLKNILLKWLKHLRPINIMVLTGDKKKAYNKAYYEANKNKNVLNTDIIFGFVKTLKKNEIINDADIDFLKCEFETWESYSNDELNKNIDNVYIGVLKDKGFNKIGCDIFNSKICCYMLTYTDKYLKLSNVKLIQYICSIYRYKGLSNIMISKYQKLYKCILIPNEISSSACSYWKKFFLKNYDVNCYDELDEKVLKKLDIEYLKKDLLEKWKRIYV